MNEKPELQDCVLTAVLLPLSGVHLFIVVLAAVTKNPSSSNLELWRDCVSGSTTSLRERRNL